MHHRWSSLSYTMTLHQNGFEHLLQVSHSSKTEQLLKVTKKKKYRNHQGRWKYNVIKYLIRLLGPPWNKTLNIVDTSFCDYLMIMGSTICLIQMPRILFESQSLSIISIFLIPSFHLTYIPSMVVHILVYFYI